MCCILLLENISRGEYCEIASLYACLSVSVCACLYASMCGCVCVCMWVCVCVRVCGVCGVCGVCVWMRVWIDGYMHVHNK